jgi:hypothetical protein
MEILSTNKPQVEQKPDVKIEYNDKSYESYIKAGFENNIPHIITGPRERINKFPSAVDTRKGPVERSVTMMVRLKAPDYTTKKNERKEWLYYFETWEAKNWLNVPINPLTEHCEGKYTEVLTRPVYDQHTGIHKDTAWGGTREVYYIPFTKTNVDEIIAKSATTDKSGIKFIVKFAAQDSISADNMALTMSMRNQFSYDMFLWPWDKLYEWQCWPIDEIATRPSAKRSATKLEFKPS